MDKRYIRQVALKEIGKDGQEKLSKACVAIAGLGAIGCTTADILARAGVGKLILIDGDKIDLVNIHRQHLYFEEDVGKSKVLAAKDRISRINNRIKVEAIDYFLSEENTSTLEKAELILDCTDNMQTRRAINSYCKNERKLWIYSAAVGTRGNVMVVDDPDSFDAIFKSAETFDECQNIGVISSATAIAGAIQSAEAIKIIVEGKHNKGLIRFDLWTGEFDRMHIIKK